MPTALIAIDFINDIVRPSGKISMAATHYLASFLVALVCLLAGTPAYAQKIEQIEADIPFAFHAGIAKFPEGKYTFHITETSEISTMEVKSADGQSSALVEIRNVQAQQPSQTTELIFTLNGGGYFLSAILDTEDKYQCTLVDVDSSKECDANMESETALHVPASLSCQSEIGCRIASCFDNVYAVKREANELKPNLSNKVGGNDMCE
jgi:hypothetical protein